MMAHIAKTIVFSVVAGLVVSISQEISGSSALTEYFQANLVTILIALLAINTATLGLVLTKVRELVDRVGQGSNYFKNTKKNMLVSIREQMVLIFLSVFCLSISGSKVIDNDHDLSFMMDVILASVFTYGILVLYDTAKSVLIIIDYDSE